MKKLARNSWILGIGTTVIGGVLLSFVLDLIKGVDWLSTLKVVVKFIVDAVITFLNLELKVWWVFVAVAFVVVVLCIISKVLDSKSENETPAFWNYTKDTILGYTWEWDYTKTYDGKCTISNLTPVCSKCGMRLKQSGLYGTEMKCLRCNTTQNWEDSYLTDARMLIDDNIRRIT